MINPHYANAKTLKTVALELSEWPEGADFVYLDDAGNIRSVEGGSAAAVNYVSREQWAVARTMNEKAIAEYRAKPYTVDVSEVDTMDVFELLRLFEVEDPALQDAIRKVLSANGAINRTGLMTGSAEKDIRDALNSLMSLLIRYGAE